MYILALLYSFAPQSFFTLIGLFAFFKVKCEKGFGLSVIINLRYSKILNLKLCINNLDTFLETHEYLQTFFKRTFKPTRFKEYNI